MSTARRVVEGDRLVFFDVHRTCGRCRACAVNRTPTRCEARRVYGITDSAAEGLFGGWAEAIYLEPGVSMAKLPDSVPSETYISGGCGLITAVHAIDRAAIMLGDSVLVQGTGAVGLSAIALARLAGATRVIAFGAPADRLELAARDGRRSRRRRAADDAGGAAQLVRDLTGGLGVDVAIEAAGSARAVEEALDLIRDGGRYVIAGHYTDAGPSAVNVHQQINKKHLEIRGCWGSEVSHFVRALRVLERHHAAIPWRAIGARTYALSELNQALADAEAMRLPKALVKPTEARRQVRLSADRRSAEAALRGSASRSRRSGSVWCPRSSPCARSSRFRSIAICRTSRRCGATPARSGTRSRVTTPAGISTSRARATTRAPPSPAAAATSRSRRSTRC